MMCLYFILVSVSLLLNILRMLSMLCVLSAEMRRGLQMTHRLRDDLYCVEWGVNLYSLPTRALSFTRLIFLWLAICQAPSKTQTDKQTDKRTKQKHGLMRQESNLVHFSL